MIPTLEDEPGSRTPIEGARLRVPRWGATPMRRCRAVHPMIAHVIFRERLMVACWINSKRPEATTGAVVYWLLSRRLGGRRAQDSRREA